jgi:hypothetical protein
MKVQIISLVSCCLIVVLRMSVVRVRFSRMHVGFSLEEAAPPAMGEPVRRSQLTHAPSLSVVATPLGNPF